MQATDGTFKEEPGSGAIATVEQKTVTVGTLNWLRRFDIEIFFHAKAFLRI